MIYLRKLLTSLTLLILLSSSLLSAVDFTQYGFSVEQKRVSGGYTIYSLKDEKNRDVKISISAGAEENRIEEVLSIHDTFDRWTFITFDTISYIAETTYTSVMVLPSDISYNGVDLLPYVRTGLTFIQEDGDLLYDIRLVEAAVNPKLSGTYTVENQLLDALYKAVETDLLGELYMGITLGGRNKASAAEAEPAAADTAAAEISEDVQSEEQTDSVPEVPAETSPDSYAELKVYLMAETQKAIDRAIDSLKEGNAKDLAYETNILGNEIDILTQAVDQDRDNADEEIAALKDTISLLEGDIASLEGAIESGREARSELEDQITLLMSEIDDLRKAILVIHNTGTFGNIRYIDRKAIERAVKLKDQDEDITQSEVHSILNREGYKVSEHAVFLIFALYFNEYY